MKIGAIGIRTKIIVGDAATWHLVKKYIDGKVGGGIDDVPEELKKYVRVLGSWVDVTEDLASIEKKVDKVVGKSLIADTEISRLAGVYNQTLSGLGGEPAANKQDSLAVDGNGVKFPTVDAVNSGLATKPSKTTQVVAGAGLTGGGTLESDRTLNVVSANDGITVNADNIQLNAVDNLASTSATQPLSANQGKVLHEAKVDKVAGSSLVPDTEIDKLAGYPEFENLEFSHATLTDKNSEAAVQHVDTTTTKETLDEADKVALWDSVTGKVVLSNALNDIETILASI